MGIELKTRANENDPRLSGWTDFPCVIVTSDDDGTYQIVAKAQFDADSLTYTASVKDVAQAKREALKRLEAFRWLKTCEMIFNGGPVASNRDAGESLTHIGGLIDARLNMIDRAAKLGVPAPATITWKLRGGQFSDFTPQELTLLGLAIGDHVQACFDNEKAISAQIQAATTSREVMAIDLTTGWPATSLAEVGG